MKTHYKSAELVALSIGIAGLVLKLIKVEFGYIIMNLGFILVGIIGLVDSIKNKYYTIKSGKLILLLLPALIITIGLSGIFDNVKNDLAILLAATLYARQLKIQRTQELAQS